MDAKPTAIPPKPKTPASIARMIKVTDQRNMVFKKFANDGTFKKEVRPVCPE